MYRAAFCFLLILIDLSWSGCGTSYLPDIEVHEDRVDSLTVRLNQGILDLTVYCSFGIGSCTIMMSEPVRPDSLELLLHYDERSPYLDCENLEVTAHVEGGGLKRIHPPGGAFPEEGRIILPVGMTVNGITVTWIDYYRS
jgi:hypothetical protein